MEKPDVVTVYNKGMNGVNANDQYQSYYTQGSVSQKRCKYLPWFFFNLSSTCLQLVHQWLYFRESWKKVQSQLAFQHELARLLIAGYDGYKHPSTSGKCVIQTLSSKENLKGHFLEKLQGRKKACAMCSKDGKKMQWRMHLQNLVWLQTRWHCLMSANLWRTLLLFEMAWKKLTIKNK